jgi:hypothetical protein
MNISDVGFKNKYKMCDAGIKLLPEPNSWQAKWIWLEDSGDGKNDYICFRKEFIIQSEIKEPVIHITAEREYELWLNGHFIGRGPALSDPRYKRYDIYRIKDIIKTGNNLISVLAYHHRESNGAFRRTPYQEASGLLCQINDGADNLLSSDETWKSVRHASWKRPGKIF